jgi:Zn-dependent peptidase ImmA (M78 family)
MHEGGMKKHYDILGCRYTARLVPKMPQGFENALGLCDTVTKTIYILKGVPEASRREILRHELGHAVMAQCGADQSVSPELLEVIVQSFASAWKAIP